jgi:hypothetical protein
MNTDFFNISILIMIPYPGDFMRRYDIRMYYWINTSNTYSAPYPFTIYKGRQTSNIFVGLNRF